MPYSTHVPSSLVLLAGAALLPSCGTHRLRAQETCTAKCDSVGAADAELSSWQSSYQPPEQDPSGMAMHATEVMALREYRGQLWAATGNWSYDASAGPRPPPQILVLDDVSARWRVAKTFDDRDASGQYRFVRVTSLEVIDDETGANQRLAATLDAVGGEGDVFVQDPATSTWVDTQLPPVMSIRALERFDDPVTGRHLIFAGGGIGASPNHLTAAGIYRGHYDSSHPETGCVVWEALEASGLQDRVMAFAPALGTVYAVDKTHLYVRQHPGTGTPVWQQVFAYTGYATQIYNNARISGLRGLTAVEDGNGNTMLLAAAEYTSEILRFELDTADPTRVTATTELDVRTALTARWGALATPNVIAAYSDMPALTGSAGQELRVLGLLTEKPGDETAAWFLVRDPSGHYALDEVPADPTTRRRSSDPTLGSIRTLWPHGGALYVAGFDGAYKPDVDTAWIYSRPLAAALTGAFALP
jgi:hypothetical protein